MYKLKLLGAIPQQEGLNIASPERASAVEPIAKKTKYFNYCFQCNSTSPWRELHRDMQLWDVIFLSK